MARRGEALCSEKEAGQDPEGRRESEETSRQSLDKDTKERPAATIPERIRFLESITGERLSYSTIRRSSKRLGWSRKKERGCRRTGRVAEGSLEGDARPTDRSAATRVRRRDGSPYFAFSNLCLFTEGTEGVLLGFAQTWAEHDTAFVHERGGYGSFSGGGRCDQP
jgi:hypothetical protein